jgi:alkanesulfonate monooxygenase SsuD/methylene tetrahydromethanopterin reductase-like flavin-dependent oxidoreductase (luciferase family)
LTIEFALQTSGTYDDLVRHATWAEEVGLAVFAVPDHYLMALGESAGVVPAFDALTQLGALARDTRSIELSVLVSPVTFRHPAVLAKTALTIDHLSGGRFSLGLGTGWMQREHEVFGLPFPSTAERFARLEESLAYIRAVFDGGQPGYVGDVYALEATPTAPRPLDRIPLVVGGTGSIKTPRLAGVYGDEYNCYPAPVEEFRIRIDRARHAAKDAGRDPDALLISSAGAVLAAPTQSEYQELLHASAIDAGMEVEELEAHMNQRNTPRGTFEQVAEQLAALAGAGMSRFYLQRSPDFDHDAAANLIGAITG